MSMSREAMDKVVNDHFMYEATADLEGVMSTYTDDPYHHVVGGPDGPLRGKAAIRPFSLEGKHGEEVRVRLLHVFKLENGLIASEKVWFDAEEMRRQLK